MIRARTSMLAAVACGALLALLFAACVAWAPAAAWAEDAESDVAADAAGVAADPENVINDQQVPDSSFLYDTSIYDLNNAELSSDGRTVQVTGEVVGDLIVAEDDAGKKWVTLESTDEAKEGSISVLIDEDSADAIDTYGEYGRTGTILRVQGTFHISCGVHEGIADIHATQVSVASAGVEQADSFDAREFVPGAALCAVGVGLVLLYRRLCEQER